MRCAQAYGEYAILKSARVLPPRAQASEKYAMTHSKSAKMRDERYRRTMREFFTPFTVAHLFMMPPCHAVRSCPIRHRLATRIIIIYAMPPSLTAPFHGAVIDAFL